MALWGITRTNWTPTAVADTINFTDNGHLTLQGGSSSQRIKLLKVYIAGLAAALAPMQLYLARNSTVGATLSGTVTLAAHDPDTAALAAPPVPYCVSTTKPQRSSTLKLHAPSLNAFGGIVNLEFAPGEEITLRGNAASFGELSISSASTGTPGLIDTTLTIEPY